MKSTNSEQKRLAFFLPNTFTALNMGCGFASILLAYKGDFYFACIILGIGAIFDSVDGRVARMTGTQSAFGEQFDSMSDVISFGVAPALLVYHKFFIDLGRIGMIGAFIYMLCGALRLARFNANIDKVSSDFFQGLPIPAAAIGIVAFVLTSLDFPVLTELPYLVVVYTIIYALLMVSNIPFPSFKNSEWVSRHKKAVLFIIFLLLASIAVYEQLMVLLIITCYVFGSILYFFLNRGKFMNVFDWETKGESENE